MTAQTKGSSLSIIQTYAATRHMEKEALAATMFKTIMPRDATMEDLVGFLQIAHRFDLDPWAKEIFCIKSKGRVSTYVGIDGYTKIVNREPQYDGCSFDYSQDDDGNITAVTCTMHRKDRSRPTQVTEFLAECIVPDSEAWRKAPGRMLRHRAFIQAARLAFGVSGALDEGVDVSGPVVDVGPIDEPEEQERRDPPKAKRSPPSPGEARKQADMQNTSTGQEPEPGDGFDLQALLDAMDTAKTVEELKAIYTDFETDDNAGKHLDAAQDAFVKAVKRIEG